MNIKEHNIAQSTRQPNLTEAVLENIELESLGDVVCNGASAGFGNFIYYSDTLPFFESNKEEIMERAKEDASDFNCSSALEMIAEFGCLRCCELTADDISEALYVPDSEWETQVKNALAWYALEEVAREISDQ